LVNAWREQYQRLSVVGNVFLSSDGRATGHPIVVSKTPACSSGLHLPKALGNNLMGFQTNHKDSRNPVRH
jgi:hypothetical protein